MSLRRIGILLEREVLRGPKNFLLIFAIVVPVILSLAVNLVFGSLFSGKPKLGILDLGNSAFPDLLRGVDSILLEEFSSESQLKSAVGRGALDLALVLPTGFDAELAQGTPIQLVGYVWGESMLKDRAILGTTIVVLLRQVVGQEPPVEIVTASIGDGESLPWEQRLLPFIVLMTVMIGGVMVPATSLVDEKQKRTLVAVIGTPATLGDVFVAKGLLGVALSVGMGVLILVMNNAFGRQAVLLVVLIFLGAVMAAGVGILLGAWVKDIDTLFATIKGLGIFLYAPALVYMFPEIPHWIGRLFPTYYIIAPIVEVTQNNATWRDVIPEVVILAGLIGLLMFAVSLIGHRMRVQEAQVSS